MKYFSTRNRNINDSFKQILFQGLSKDGGLYIPTYWPKINLDEINNITYEELALNIIYPYIQNDISKNEIYEIICKSYKNFNHPKIAPIVQIDENIRVLGDISSESIPKIGQAVRMSVSFDTRAKYSFTVENN